MPQNAPGLQKDATEKQGLHPGSVFLTAFSKQLGKNKNIFSFFFQMYYFSQHLGKGSPSIHFRLSEAGECIWNEPRAPKGERRSSFHKVLPPLCHARLHTWAALGPRFLLRAVKILFCTGTTTLCIELKMRTVPGQRRLADDNQMQHGTWAGSWHRKLSESVCQFCPY